MDHVIGRGGGPQLNGESAYEQDLLRAGLRVLQVIRVTGPSLRLHRLSHAHHIEQGLHVSCGGLQVVPFQRRDSVQDEHRPLTGKDGKR